MHGIQTVGDLLASNPREIAAQLQAFGVNEAAVRRWQGESELMCKVPQLRAFDARLLYGSGVTSHQQLALMHPGQLLQRVEAFWRPIEDKRSFERETATNYRASRLGLSRPIAPCVDLSHRIANATRPVRRLCRPLDQSQPTISRSNDMTDRIKLDRRRFMLSTMSSRSAIPSIDRETMPNDSPDASASCGNVAREKLAQPEPLEQIWLAVQSRARMFGATMLHGERTKLESSR